MRGLSVIAWSSEAALKETMGHILNAFQLEGQVFEEQLDVYQVFTWCVGSPEYAFKAIVTNGQILSLSFSELKRIERLARIQWADQPLEPMVVVDPQAPPTRSRRTDDRLLQNAEELIAYLGVGDVARIPDMDALDLCVKPMNPRVEYEMIPPFQVLHAMFFGPVPRSIPNAPAPKRSLPDEWKARLCAVEPTDNSEEACLACFENKRTIKIFPCEHLFYCDDCFERMMTSDTCQKQCPECRGEVESIKSVGKTKRIKTSE